MAELYGESRTQKEADAMFRPWSEIPKDEITRIAVSMWRSILRTERRMQETIDKNQDDPDDLIASGINAAVRNIVYYFQSELGLIRYWADEQIRKERAIIPSDAEKLERIRQKIIKTT
jgi:hypothetical protein